MLADGFLFHISIKFSGWIVLGTRTNRLHSRIYLDQSPRFRKRQGIVLITNHRAGGMLSIPSANLSLRLVVMKLTSVRVADDMLHQLIADGDSESS